MFLFHFLRRANFAPPLPIFFPAHRINAYMFKLGVRTRKCVANQYSGCLGHVAWHCGFCWNEVWGSERQAKKKRKNLVSQYDTFSLIQPRKTGYKMQWPIQWRARDEAQYDCSFHVAQVCHLNQLLLVSSRICAEVRIPEAGERHEKRYISFPFPPAPFSWCQIAAIRSLNIRPSCSTSLLAGRKGTPSHVCTTA